MQLQVHKVTEGVTVASGSVALTSSFQVYAPRRCCRYVKKMIKHHPKAETISKLTVYAQLLPAKNYIL